MTHPVQSLAVAAAAALSERVVSKGYKVFRHHRERLDERQDELPAYSVDVGEDAPAEQQPLRGISSVLDLVFTAVCVAPTSDECREKLFEMRDYADSLMDEQMHNGLAGKFGLSFVYGIGYGGASAPEINSEGESCSGSISSTWKVGYRLR